MTHLNLGNAYLNVSLRYLLTPFLSIADFIIPSKRANMNIYVCHIAVLFHLLCGNLTQM